jgi:hypothetical protein
VTDTATMQAIDIAALYLPCVGRQRSCDESGEFDGPGVASRNQDPRQGEAGGQNRGVEAVLVSAPHDYHPNHGWSDFFVLPGKRGGICG